MCIFVWVCGCVYCCFKLYSVVLCCSIVVTAVVIVLLMFVLLLVVCQNVCPNSKHMVLFVCTYSPFFAHVEHYSTCVTMGFVWRTRLAHLLTHTQEGETNRETDRDRATGRQGDRETGRARQIDRHTYRERQGTERQTCACLYESH